MRYIDVLLTANANLQRSKLRTLLTISAVFMGALTLMLTTGVGAGLKTYVEEQVNAAGAKDALIIMSKSDSFGPISNDEVKEYNPDMQASSGDFGAMPTLTSEDLDVIRSTEGILEVDPLYSVVLEYIATKEKKYQANISQALEGLNIPLKAGRPVNASGADYEITIAPAFVEALGFASPGQATGQTAELAFKDVRGELFTIEATIVGVQEKTLIQGNAMAVSISLAREAFTRSTEGLPEFQRFQYVGAVAKFDASMSTQSQLELKQQLEKEGFNAQTLDDQLGVINSVIDGIITFLTIFAAIALAAASFGIVNTLLMAVKERTREIGLMKALGMGRKKIFLLFSIEAILIGFWGSIIALGAANIIGRIGSSFASSTLLSDFEGLRLFSFPATSMLPIVLLIMVIAFLAATLPARQASRLDPIEALRYE